MAIWYKKIHLSTLNRLVLKDHPKILRLLNVTRITGDGHSYDARVYFVVDTESLNFETQILEVQSLPTGESDVEESGGQFLGTVVIQVGTIHYVWHHFGRVIQ